MESVTLKLCDSRDYFASSLLVKKTVKIVTAERKLLFRALVSNCSHRSCPDISEKKFQIKTITSSTISQQLWHIVQSATRGKQIVCSRQLLCYRLSS